MVDGLRYKDEVIDELKTLSRTDKDKNLSTVSINDYAENVAKEKKTGKKKIAIIYANGDIISGEGDDQYHRF